MNKENKGIALSETGENPAVMKATNLHYRIKANIETAADAIVDFSVNLKIMRDEKLYVELGYAEFGDYTKEALGIEWRQAYSYISNYEKLGKDFLQSNATLGVTKLSLLAAASYEDREYAKENFDLENMTTKELQEEINSLKEQITFLENAPKAEIVEQKPFEEIEEEIRCEVEATIKAEYESRLAELQEKTISDSEIKKIREEAQKEATLKVKDEIKKINDEKKIFSDKLKIAEDKAQTAAEAENKAKASAAEVSMLKAQIEAANEKTAIMEKQIKISSNPELTKFKFIFEDAQRTVNSMVEQYSKLDEQTQPKMKAAIEALIGGIEL